MKSGFLSLMILCLGLAACTVPVERSVPSGTTKTPFPTQPTRPVDPTRLDGRTAVRNFVAVVETIEPIAERVCRQRAPLSNCDFQIVVDDAVNAPPNAFQTVDANGRPILAFTIPLIAEARNRDELAFIMAHEAAHHILGHLARQRQNANLGAALAGTLFGGDGAAQRTVQQIGAAIGARSYSKDFELEADELGTVIAAQGGYDPLIGAMFFNRIPDPGNRFLGTHPANSQRIATVQRVVAGL